MFHLIVRKEKRFDFGFLSCFALLLLVFTGCKSTVEKNAGTYTIENYTFQGNDSLPQLRRNFLDGDFNLKEDFTFNSLKHTGIIYQLNDSLIYFSGHYNYLNSDSKIEFVADVSTSIAVFDGRIYKIIYFSDPHAGAFQPPLFYEGIWNIEKEGKQSLLLELDGDKNTKLNLRRVNTQ